MPWEPYEAAVRWTDLVSETPPDEQTVAPALGAAAPRDASIGAFTRRLARGEEEAYREFHRDYFDRLYRLLLVLCHGQETEAREALQDTLCRVARHVRRFDDPEIFWCWLGVLARSAARDAGRKRRRYWRLLVDYAQRWLPVERPPADDLEQQLEALLLECLGELDPADRSLVEEKYFSRRSIGELARDTGLTERAVESRLFRLRGQLRESLLCKLRKDPL